MFSVIPGPRRPLPQLLLKAGITERQVGAVGGKDGARPRDASRYARHVACKVQEGANSSGPGEAIDTGEIDRNQASYRE